MKSSSRLAKPDARHHGGRQDDPAHKPASSVDAVRVPHGVRRRRTREQQERSVEVAKPHRPVGRGVLCAGFGDELWHHR